MKFYSLLIVVALFAAALVGHYSVYFHEDYQASRSEGLSLQELKLQFIKTTSPIAEIDLSNYFQSISRAELLRPHDDKKQKNSGPVDYFLDLESNHCVKMSKQKLPANTLSKYWLWEKFRCRLIKEIPEDFFVRRPYLHPSGKSYVQLAIDMRMHAYHSIEWVKEHLALFHISELSELQEDYGDLPEPYSYLSELNRWSQMAVYNSENIILTANYVMFQPWNIFNPQLGSYVVYLRSDFEEFLQKTEYNISQYIPGKRCFFTDSQLCWNLSLRELLAKRGLRNLLTFVLIILFVLVIVWIIFSRLKVEKREDAKRKLALSVLTHELRTPIAAQVLLVEQLMNRIDHFRDEDQNAIFELSSSTHRLQRMIVNSQKYLKTSFNSELINLNLKWVASVNSYLEEIIDDDEGVTFQKLEQDQSFYFDEYWFPLCVKNLLANARAHGKPPIVVYIQKSKQGASHWLEVVIQDAGQSEFVNLEDMIGEFIKSGKSEGLGLGLNIVSKVVKAMGGVLTFRSRPTRFSIQLKDSHDQSVVS